ncbi:hypothetical protein KVV02_001127 [Mortierella alpina]|uniref:Uncharacterized protein n=1 Tax=Mortierella alpina TaxID=64518 RepID=A0A9P7ZZS6_MORAP|nr:hypothetical protein KVV02_001127 [Mortierella alpina]
MSAAATTTTSTTYQNPTVSPSPDPINNLNHLHDHWLCDFMRIANHCRGAEFVRVVLLASTIIHVLMAIYGTWILSYRNRGMNRRIVTGLFTRVGTGFRPKPLDCIVFFPVVASLLKIPANLTRIGNTSHVWLQTALEQLYCNTIDLLRLCIIVGHACYVVGVIYAMPVTTCEGVRATYQPDIHEDERSHRVIHVLYPTPWQRNMILAMSSMLTGVFTVGGGIVSGTLYDQGHYQLSAAIERIRYLLLSIVFGVLATFFMYYVIKHTAILRANILIAEAKLKTNHRAFGLKDLRSASPARFLLIMMQCTGFGGFMILLVAATIALVWAVFSGMILQSESIILHHILAVVMSCGLGPCCLGKMALIHVQSVRNRKRGLHATQPHSLSHASQGSNRTQSRSGPIEEVLAMQDMEALVLMTSTLLNCTPQPENSRDLEHMGTRCVVHQPSEKSTVNSFAASATKVESPRTAARDDMTCYPLMCSSIERPSVSLAAVYGAEHTADLSESARQDAPSIISYFLKRQDSERTMSSQRTTLKSPSDSTRQSDLLSVSSNSTFRIERQLHQQLRQQTMQKLKELERCSWNKQHMEQSKLGLQDLRFGLSMSHQTQPTSCQGENPESQERLPSSPQRVHYPMDSSPLDPHVGIGSLVLSPDQCRRISNSPPWRLGSLDSKQHHDKDRAEVTSLPTYVQQQHPLHMVTFKGLHPPPRSLPSSPRFLPSSPRSQPSSPRSLPSRPRSLPSSPTEQSTNSHCEKVLLPVSQDPVGSQFASAALDVPRTL